MSMTKQMVVDQNTHWIKSGQSVALNFSLDMDEAQMEDSSFRLQLRGRAGIHPSWMYEGGLPYLFRDIDDALCTETDHSRFSLRIRCRGRIIPGARIIGSTVRPGSIRSIRFRLMAARPGRSPALSGQKILKWKNMDLRRSGLRLG